MMGEKCLISTKNEARVALQKFMPSMWDTLYISSLSKSMQSSFSLLAAAITKSTNRKLVEMSSF